VLADRVGKGGVMRVLKAILYGYAGAALAGVLAALAGTGFDLSYGMIVSSASLSGAAFGIVGFTLPWWQPLVAVRSRNRGD